MRNFKETVYLERWVFHMAAASSKSKKIKKPNGNRLVSDGKTVMLGTKTTIRGRIVRLSVIGVLAAIITLTAFNLIMMYSSVSA